MRKNNFMNKIIKLKGSISAGIIQIFACLIVYKFNIPNPNIVLFVVLSASIVQSGYLAGIISGVIAVLYSAFFFSTDHSWIFYTPINRDKLCVIVLGVISNIILVGNLQEANRQAEHKIAKLESEKKQKKKELEQQDELRKALIAADAANRAKSTFLLNMSHDIRTPLNGIMGLLKINMAHSDDEELVRENYKEMEKAAKVLSDKLPSTVGIVIKGGHLDDTADDLLYVGGENHWINGKRIDNPNTHGTGCTFSSAIACNLALTSDKVQAVTNAKEYLAGAIAAKLDLGKGSGPLMHNYKIVEKDI